MPQQILKEYKMFYSLSKLLLALVLLSDISPLMAKEVDIKTLKVDVATDYGVLVTEIHYDEKQRAQALEVREIIRNDLIKVVNYFKYVPHDMVHINLDPYYKFSNGNAITFPTNTINLYPLAPSNQSHLMGVESWMQGLLVHEYIHLTHLDKTRGIWNIGRHIFGTIAKIPTGVVPSWFTEGIATWGESHLIKGGRLHHSLFNTETVNYFLRNNKCETIDCLDNPESFPNRSLAYWAGSHFIQYLENKKPDTVACLVHKNASSFPFLLNEVFSECTGKTAQDNFEDFKKEMLESLPPMTKEQETWGEVIKNTYGYDNFQKGIVFDGKQLFKVEVDRYHEALVSYDREDNVPMVTKSYPYPIGEITETFVTKSSGENEESKYLIMSFLDDPNFRETSKNWYLVDAFTLDIEKKLPFSYDPQYVNYLGDRLFLLSSFENGKWTLSLSRLNEDLSKEESHYVLANLDQSFHLKGIEKKGDYIYMMYNQFESNLISALLVNAIKELRFENQLLYKTQNVLNVMMTDIDGAIFKDGEDYFFIDRSSGEFELFKLKPEAFRTVTKMYISDDLVVVLSNRIKSNKLSKGELFKKIKEEGTFQEKLVLKDIGVGLPAPYMLDQKEENFPQFYHFIPHYWFLTSGSSENVSSIGLQTAFNDPMDYTTAQVNVLTFPEISKVGGNFNLNHRFQNPSDLLGVNVYLEQDYFQSNASTVVNQTRKLTLSAYYTFLQRDWNFTPMLTYGFEDASDFISTNKLRTQSASFLTNYQAIVYQSFWQKFNLLASIQRSQLEEKKDFYTFKSKASSEWRFTNRFVGGVNVSYAKQFKDDFNRGVIFGGGSSDYLNARFFEFYGIPYGDVYGNEISTLRLFLDYNLWDVYRGRNLFPLFIKEVHLLLGREFLSADRILIENKGLLRDKVISSVFFGPKITGNVFYYVPFELEIIFSHIRQSQIGTLNNVEANIKISL